MTWRCSACTYDNKPGDSKCEICETVAAAAGSSSDASCTTQKPSSSSSSFNNHNKAKKSRQATLSGGFLTKAEEKSTMQKQSRKRSSAKVSSTEEETQQQSQPPLPINRKKAPSASSSSNILPTRPAAAATTATGVVPTHLQVKSNNVTLQELSRESQRIMKEVFKIDKLRNLQPHAVQHALSRQSQLVVMATGGGKSLCYQLPACVRGGTTIVISPLKALIADQVNALLNLGIAAAFISSSNPNAQNNQVLERLFQRRPLGKQTAAAAVAKTTTQSTMTGSQGQKQEQQFQPITLLYCTPEQVQTSRFRDCLITMEKENRLAGFAVDEAHCISSWGHDFRGAYLKLTWLRETFPHLPLMACTATATKKVIENIQDILNLKDRPLLIGSFDRKNVFYKVRYKDVLNIMSPQRGALGDLIDFIKNQHNMHTTEGKPYSGIVYVHKKSDTAELARAITKETGIRAETYHGGMKDAERQSVQHAWTTGQVKIVIATVAFGMGVDLAHVRFVIHWTMPKNVESFYQESGRAGRDGLAAFSLLYHSREEQSKLKFLASTQKSTKENNAAQRAIDGLEKMAQYCLLTGCRRQFLLRFFGEKEDETDPKTVCRGSCDYCLDPDKVTRSIEAAVCANDFTYHTRPAKATNGQWASASASAGPNDYDDDDKDDFSNGNNRDSNGLKITGGTDDDDDGGDEDDMSEKDSKPSAVGFVKASAILQKYEAIECQENTSNGFVRFRSRGDDHTEDGVVANKKRKAALPPTLPEHLRALAPDPLMHFEKQPDKSSEHAPPAISSAKDASAEVARLRAETEEAAKAAREALAAARSKKSSAPPPPPPPPPPSLAFSKRRR